MEWDDEKDKLLKKYLSEDFMTDEEIGKKFKCSGHQVYWHRKKKGLFSSVKYKELKIAELGRNGMSIKKIAETMNVARFSVSRILKRYDIKPMHDNIMIKNKDDYDWLLNNWYRFSNKYLAERLNISYKQVHNFLLYRGFDSKARFYKCQECVKNMLNDGKSIKEISGFLNTSNDQIKK